MEGSEIFEFFSLEDQANFMPLIEKRMLGVKAAWRRENHD